LKRLQLIDNFNKAHKLSTIWVAGFWGLLGACLAILEAYGQNVLSPFWFCVLMIVMSVTIAIARVTKQPGIE